MLRPELLTMTEAKSPATLFLRTRLPTAVTGDPSSPRMPSSGASGRGGARADLRSRLPLCSRRHSPGLTAPAGWGTLCFQYRAGKSDLVPEESRALPDLIF